MKSILYFSFCIACFSPFLGNSDESHPSQPPLSTGKYTAPAVTTEPRGLITPTVAPRVEKGFDIVVEGSFIWWKPYVSNFEYAQIDGDVLSPKTQFEPGFKVGTGMDLYHDGWDVYSEYTWLYQPESRNAGTATTVGASLIVPSRPVGETLSGDAVPLLDTTAWRKFQFNVLDLEVGRNFFISKRLTLRPHVGLKGASLFEKTKVIYTGPSDLGAETLHIKQNMSGIGIRGGLNTLWHITPSLGFYGDFDVTALWASFHNSLASETVIEDLYFLYSDLYRTAQGIIPVLEVGAGLSYCVNFKNQRYQLFIKAGWEEQVWLDYNQNLIYNQKSAGGNLTLQGLTAELGWIF